MPRVKNISGGPITTMFDGIQVSFESGEERDLDQGIANHLVAKEAGLEIAQDLEKYEERVDKILNEQPEVAKNVTIEKAEQFACPECGMIAKNKLGLNSHIRHKHSKKK